MVFILYGFSTLPQIGERNRETFRTEFCFSPRFLTVLPAEAGFFVMFSLLQKCGLGKVLSVNYLFGLFELKFLRVVRVNSGSDRAAQRAPRPDADDLAQNACFLAAADECVPQAHIYAADELGLLAVVLLKMRALFILGGGKIGFDLFCNFVVVKDPYILRRIFLGARFGRGGRARFLTYFGGEGGWAPRPKRPF